MKYQKKIVVFIFFILNLSVINAQKVKCKYGKISMQELEMKYYEQDSTAEAVVLYDSGNSYFNFLTNNFHLIFNRHIRIKILNKNGLDYANFEIPMYRNGGVGEDITNIKAKIYNLEGNKVAETKLSKENYFIEKTSEMTQTAKVAFPGVKVGSVIDFVYAISSDYLFSLRPWYFQRKIPVVYSEYKVEIPEVIYYHTDFRGFDIINIKKDSYSRDNGQIRSNFITWSTKNVPAFKEEPYLTTYKDYVASIIFELSSIQIPGRAYDYFSDSWAHVDKDLRESYYFGKKLKVSNSFKNMGNEIIGDAKDKYEKMLKIYTYVQENYHWTGFKTKYAYIENYKLKKEKKGHSGDINFLLLRLLSSQGIIANPIILSTRDHGLIFPFHATNSGFNYVIIEASIDGKKYYLDATSKITPAGMLPKRCLNREGRLFTAGVSHKVDIIPSQIHSTSKMYSIKILPGAGVEGSVNCIYKGYAALETRDNMTDAGGVEEYIKEYMKESVYDGIEAHSFENYDDKYKPLKEKFNFSISEDITFADDMIYLTPLLNEKREDNPFKLEERKYPVDYAYKVSKSVIMQYKIPEGYEIIETPKSVKWVISGKTASYQYNVSNAGNTVQVISIFKINKPVFQFDTYKDLKNFYDLVIKKQNEKIVFKKKA